MNENHHPGRSVDFLSRLHDGELTPAERTRFEVHRAHCAECRRAAVEFEDALSMFRSARSTPPRADLAARILRKVQSTNRARVPFSPQFRLDLGWTALLATALLALLITTPIVVQRPETAPPPTREQQSTAPELAEAPPTPLVVERPVPVEAPVELRRQAPRDRLADGSVTPSDLRKAEKEAAPPSIAAARPSRRSQARTAAQSDREPSQRAPTEEGRAVAMAPAAPSAADQVEADSALANAGPLKLMIEPIDGFGPAPALRSRTLTGVAPARGREFVLLVDSQGAVRKVTVRKVTAGESRDDDLRAEAAGDDRGAASIEKLQFEPGKRPRRLLVRIE